MAKKNKATQAEMLRREEHLVRMICNCESTSAMIEYCESLGMSTFSAQNYISTVRVKYREIAKEVLKDTIGEELMALNQFIREADEAGDRRQKLEAIKQRQKLLGVEKTTIDISGELNIPNISIVLNEKK